MQLENLIWALLDAGISCSLRFTGESALAAHLLAHTTSRPTASQVME